MTSQPRDKTRDNTKRDTSEFGLDLHSIQHKIWTPPFDVQKYTCYFCVLGPENTPPPPHTCPTLLC